MKLLIAVFITLSLFVGRASPVLAVTVKLNDVPSTISDAEFTVGVEVTGASVGTNYLRIDLYEEGTSNYFGETYNGSSWVSGSDGKQYFAISISEGASASATLRGKIGQPSSTDYSGPGEYMLRIRRYTTSGGQASGDDQTPATISISWATPAPSLSPSPSPSPSPLLSPSPSPSPSRTPSPTPSPSPSRWPSPSPSPTPEESESPEEVMLTDAATEVVSVSPSPEVLAGNDTRVSKPFPVHFVLIGSGLVLLLASGGLYMYTQRKHKVPFPSTEGNS